MDIIRDSSASASDGAVAHASARASSNPNPNPNASVSDAALYHYAANLPFRKLVGSSDPTEIRQLLV